MSAVEPIAVLDDIEVVRISAPLASKQRMVTSNIVTRAAPRSPFLSERRRVSIFVSRFMTVISSLVNDRVAQNYVRGELHLGGRLITFDIHGTDCRQRYTDGNHDKFGGTWRHF